MPLIDVSDAEANWHEVLALWSRVANWTHYKPSERQLNQEMKQFLVALWSEKDWLTVQYPAKRGRIEKFIDESESLSIVGDLANTAKHRALTRKQRSSVAQTSYYGKVSVSGGASRRLHYLRLANGRHVEIMSVLRSAIDELQEFRLQLRAGC